jgi:hypothetical protein
MPRISDIARTSGDVRDGPQPDPCTAAKYTYTLNLITSSSMNADLAIMNVVRHGLVRAGARAAAISSSRF